MGSAIGTEYILYGTTSGGGAYGNNRTVFQLTPSVSGGTWTESVLYGFQYGCDSGAKVAANSTCTVGITFTPSAAGSESASLALADNAADSPQSVPLTGAGEDFSLSATSQNGGPVRHAEASAAASGGFGPLLLRGFLGFQVRQVAFQYGTDFAVVDVISERRFHLVRQHAVGSGAQQGG